MTGGPGDGLASSDALHPACGHLLPQEKDRSCESWTCGRRQTRRRPGRRI